MLESLPAGSAAPGGERSGCEDEAKRRGGDQRKASDGRSPGHVDGTS
jgi:hypothetical protein